MSFNLFNRNPFAPKSRWGFWVKALVFFLIVLVVLFGLSSIKVPGTSVATGTIRRINPTWLNTTNVVLVTDGIRSTSSGGVTSNETYSIALGDEATVKKAKLASIKREPVVVEYREYLFSSLQFTDSQFVISDIKSLAQAEAELRNPK